MPFLFPTYCKKVSSRDVDVFRLIGGTFFGITQFM